MVINIVIGVLIGWLAEWLFYTFYWKKQSTNKSDITKITKQNTANLKLIADLEKKVAGHKKEQDISGEKLTDSTNKVAELEAKLQEKIDELKATNAAMLADNSDDTAITNTEEVVNNLTTIAGVGPKLQEALNDCGIHSFNHLIATDMDELLSTLKEKGVRFNQANAATWAQQATLAAQGDWSGLDALKAELKG